jgi:Ca2+-binding EF-hand superfamily protein
MSSGRCISLLEAATILQTELNYDKARAMHFVKQFDKNGDGQLCADEFEGFKTTIRDTKEQMTKKFKECDTDASGMVSLDEAKSVLRHAPFNFSDDKVKLLLERFDKDGNGQLDVNEFIGFYAEATAINEDIGRRFDAIDADGNGVLSHDELINVICDTLNYEPSKARQFVDSFDTNKDGSIDKKEFVGMWSIMFGKP